MAITRLVAVTIAGKIEEFENIVSRYICNSDIHLENVMKVLGDREKLEPFSDSVQYESVIRSAENILRLAGIPTDTGGLAENGKTLGEMNAFIDELNQAVEEINSEQKALTEEIGELEKTKVNIENIKNVNCDLGTLADFEFISYRYGHIPRRGYKMLNTYLSDMDIVFVKTHEDDTSVWGFYFAPSEQTGRVDEIFASLYFERVDIPKGLSGTPAEIAKGINKRISELKERLAGIAERTRFIIKDSEEELLGVYATAVKRQQLTSVRSMAAHSKEFFYLVGWMSRKDAKKLEQELGRDEGVILFYSEKPENLKGIISPPTKLKNNIIFRPFESFVNMYGYPGYNEIDPTPLLAFTYILFFGMMFGDVGQSAVFAILGFLVYRKTKWQLAGIISRVGVSGIIFGFLYGSVFGNEEIIHGILPPMDNISTLLIGTMSMGAVIIVIGMILNVINSYKQQNIPEMILSHNGIAGIVFYTSLILLALSMLLPVINIPSSLLITLIVVSLLLIYFKEQITALAEHKKIPGGAMSYVQQFFELFEVLLSYFSNTISFLRIGAFAIVHVGMMMAVSVLSNGGTARFVIVSILGNILVMVLEGLVVGIQVLRLEYYEMFSRYFTGNGKPFVSLKDRK